MGHEKNYLSKRAVKYYLSKRGISKRGMLKHARSVINENNELLSSIVGELKT